MKNIIVVEDRWERWLKLANVLNQAGYDPQRTGSEAQVLKLAHTADLVIIDRELRNIEALKLCQQLRVQNLLLPSILFAIDSLEEVEAAQVNDWLEYPIFPKETLLRVKLQLSNSELWLRNAEEFCKRYCSLSAASA